MIEGVAVSDDERTLLTRNFLLLWTGGFISQMGDRLAMVAFPWLVYKTTESAFSTAVMLALYTLPYVLFGTFAGVIIDRADKRHLMVAADVARAVLILLVPITAATWLPGVFILSFLAACVNVFFEPCRYAILPELVPARELLRANSLMATTENLTDVIGYSAAGFVAFYLSTSSAFYIDGLTFLVSAVALILLVYRPAPRGASEEAPAGVGAEALEGLAHLWRQSGLRTMTIIVSALAIAGGATYPLSFLLAVNVIGGGARSFGLMEGALGLGYLLGALALAGLGDRLRKGPAITIGCTLMGAAFALVGAAPRLVPVLVLFVVVGVANAAAIISVDTYFQEAVPERLSGRVWGIRFTLTQGLYAVSVLAGGAAAAGVSIPTLFVVCGLLIALPGLIGLHVPAARRA